MNCSLSTKNRAYLALQEAKTVECKTLIINQACFFEVIKSLDHSIEYKQLDRKCPYQNKQKTSLCLPIENINLILNQINLDQDAEYDQYIVVNQNLIHNQDICNDYCLTYFGARYSIYEKKHQPSNNCYCIKDLDLNLVNDYLLNELECFNNNPNNVLIQQTNLFGIFILIFGIISNHKII